MPHPTPEDPAVTGPVDDIDIGPVGRPEIYQNEFAMVEVTRYQTETGVRLRIRDLSSGAEVFLDPMELEGLTRWKHQDFAPLVDPSGLVATGEPDPDQV